MKKDLRSVVSRLAAFLGKEETVKDGEKMEALLNHLSFDKMKTNKAVNKAETVEVKQRIRGNKRKKFHDASFPCSFVLRPKIRIWKHRNSCGRAKWEIGKIGCLLNSSKHSKHGKRRAWRTLISNSRMNSKPWNTVFHVLTLQNWEYKNQSLMQTRCLLRQVAPKSASKNYRSRDQWLWKVYYDVTFFNICRGYSFTIF